MEKLHGAEQWRSPAMGGNLISYLIAVAGRADGRDGTPLHPSDWGNADRAACDVGGGVKNVNPDIGGDFGSKQPGNSKERLGYEIYGSWYALDCPPDRAGFLY